MENCIFCKLIKGEIPSARLYEDEYVFAFLDIMPISKGHTLVIPKGHYETLIDVPRYELEKLMGNLHKITSAVVEATKAEGFNIVMNNKKVAGQVVPHAHFHIIPRFSNDGLELKWPQQKYKEQEIEEFKKKIIRFL